jgi:hypothetical protein
LKERRGKWKVEVERKCPTGSFSIRNQKNGCGAVKWSNIDCSRHFLISSP